MKKDENRHLSIDKQDLLNAFQIIILDDVPRSLMEIFYDLIGEFYVIYPQLSEKQQVSFQEDRDIFKHGFTYSTGSEMRLQRNNLYKSSDELLNTSEISRTIKKIQQFLPQTTLKRLPISKEDKPYLRAIGRLTVNFSFLEHIIELLWKSIKSLKGPIVKKLEIADNEKLLSKKGFEKLIAALMEYKEKDLKSVEKIDKIINFLERLPEIKRHYDKLTHSKHEKREGKYYVGNREYKTQKLKEYANMIVYSANEINSLRIMLWHPNLITTLEKHSDISEINNNHASIPLLCSAGPSTHYKIKIPLSSEYSSRG